MFPSPRNVLFTGRDELLEAVRLQLCTIAPKASNHCVALYGLAGIGKTQVALEYAYRYQNCYEGLYWIRASNSTSLLNGFGEIASLTECTKTSTSDSQNETASGVVKWLSSQRSWLMVFNSLDDISVVENYMPDTSERRHILITSRDSDTRAIPAEGMFVDALTEEAAIELLRLCSTTGRRMSTKRR